MHSFHHNKTEITIHHNGDYSGDAIIVLPSKFDRQIHRVDGSTEIQLPASVLVEFSRQATIDEITGLLEEL